MFALLDSFRARAAFRAADIIDLTIEFATLGEYGLEYQEHSTARDRSAVRGCPADSRRLNPTRNRPSPRRNPTHRDAPCRDRRHRTEQRRAGV